MGRTRLTGHAVPGRPDGAHARVNQRPAFDHAVTRLTGQAAPGRPDGAHSRAPAGLTVVADLPVEWTAVQVPVVPSRGGGQAFPPRFRPVERRRVKTCVEISPVYAQHRLRLRAHVGSTVEVGAAIQVAHRSRVVDPLPGILAEDDELLAVLAEML